MLTDTEVGQFVAFGYVVLRDCLDPEELAGLQEAFDRVIETAPILDLFGTAGSRRLMPFVEADDSFQGLIEHPRIMEAMRDIDGTEFLYTGGSDLTANVDDVFWHCDGTPRTAAQDCEDGHIPRRGPRRRRGPERNPWKPPSSLQRRPLPLLRSAWRRVPKKGPRRERQGRRSRKCSSPYEAGRRRVVGQPSLALRVEAARRQATQEHVHQLHQGPGRRPDRRPRA